MGGSVTGTTFVVCSQGKFQPGRLDEIQETKPQWWNVNLNRSRLSTQLCGLLQLHC